MSTAKAWLWGEGYEGGFRPDAHPSAVAVALLGQQYHGGNRCQMMSMNAPSTSSAVRTCLKTPIASTILFRGKRQ